jgi:hypothetical protein
MFLAAIAAPGAPGIDAAFAVPQDARDINGTTVTSVRHSGGGRFTETGPGQWTEFGANGRVSAVFQVYNRDTFTVELHDRSRNTSVIIDLRARTIRSGTIGRGQVFLYSITGLEANRRNDDRGGPDRGGPGRDVRDRDARDNGRAIEAGPIWNQRDAETKCNNKARELRGEWTGQWWTTQPGRMSVCQIEFRGGGRGDGGWGRNDRDDWGRDGTRDVEVGPIWNQRDAETKCNNKAREIGADWTGNWNTVRAGVSVCGMRMRGGGGGGRWDQRDVLRNIEVGPIWNQNDAVAKCNAKGRELRAEWTGQWRTTQTGRMSECEFRFR